MGLITKKDVIRNLASLREGDDEIEDDQEYAAYSAQDGGLLDDDEHRRSGESD
jgi:hypothetical protein